MPAIPITAQDIRRVEFRERLRGYHQGDVDEFLERVAGALEQLEAQLKQAGERGPGDRLAPTPVPASPAMAPATRVTGAPGSEQSLRRTLELAQRAADLAVQEAREQGAAVVAAAEAEAEALVGTAEEQARALADEAQRDVRAEVARLEAARDQLRAELEVLTRVVDEERERGRRWLSEVAAALDRPAPPPPGQAPPAAEPTVDEETPDEDTRADNAEN